MKISICMTEEYKQQVETIKNTLLLGCLVIALENVKVINAFLQQGK